jgi:competence protein ComEA
MTRETDSDAPVLLHPRLQSALCLATATLIVGLWIGSQGSADRSRDPIEHHAVDARRDAALVIDLNAATLQELMLLPGIGPKTAERILADRRRHGPFEGVVDLQRVAGIGPKTVQSIAPYCRAVVLTGGELIAEN